MSVQRECRFYEIEPGLWYLLIAQREHGTIAEGPASAFGPFPSQSEAERYLDGEFSNPGGYIVCAYEPGIIFSPMVLRLVAKAKRPWRADSLGFRLPDPPTTHSFAPSDPGFASRTTPLVCYPIERGCFRDVYTGFVVESLAAAERLGYKIFDRSEAQLYASRYHHIECSCAYCTEGREALSGSDY